MVLIIVLTFNLLLTVESTYSTLLQASSVNKNNFERQELKVYLLPCNEKTKCTPHVEIKFWLNVSRAGEEIFLLIDEAFDLSERAYSSLLHPYLVRVSTTEAVVSYPLQLEQIVDVPCSGNDVQRREAFGKSKGAITRCLNIFILSPQACWNVCYRNIKRTRERESAPLVVY
jgi:hypothetical protein